MQIFDELAGTKCLAGMFEIWFCAGTKILWPKVAGISFFHSVPANANFGLPVQYIVPCTGKRCGIFMMLLHT
jgi:hypothetical protein